MALEPGSHDVSCLMLDNLAYWGRYEASHTWRMASGSEFRDKSISPANDSMVASSSQPDSTSVSPPLADVENGSREGSLSSCTISLCQAINDARGRRHGLDGKQTRYRASFNESCSFCSSPARAYPSLAKVRSISRWTGRSRRREGAMTATTLAANTNEM